MFPHRHDYYELYFCLCDSLEYIIANKLYELRYGDLILLPPGFMHYPAKINTRPGERYTRMVLWCSVEFFEKFLAVDPDLDTMWKTAVQNSQYHIRPSAVASQHLRVLYNRLIDEKRQPGFCTRAASFSVLLELFTEINRLMQQGTNTRQYVPASDTFNKIVYYIHTHLTDSLSLEELSARFFVSKGYISRIFRENMGVSVHQYILALRLNGCQDAIKKGVPITAAAQLYGFEDYSGFYRAFKSAFHVSPKEYLKSVQQ